MISRAQLLAAVGALVEAQMGFPVGVGDLPTEVGQVHDFTSGVGLVELINIGDTSAEGEGYTGSEGHGRVRVQLTGHGVTSTQATLCAELMAAVLLERTGGAWVHDLSVDGHSVMHRRSVGIGNPDNEGGIHTCPYLVDVSIHADGS